MKTLLSAALSLLLLSGCLSDDSECNYFRLYDNMLTAHPWKIDSLKLFVYDSTSLYQLDTVILNAGTWEFRPENPGYCVYKGTLFYATNTGTTYNVPYSYFFTFRPNNQMLGLEFPENLDGYNGTPLNSFCIYVTETRLYVGSGTPAPFCEIGFPHTQLKRVWIFVLSAKP